MYATMPNVLPNFALVEASFVVDCHDHSVARPRPSDPVHAVLNWCMAATCTTPHQTTNSLHPRRETQPGRTLARAGKAWRRTCSHRLCARSCGGLCRKFYDEDELTLDALRRMHDRLLTSRDTATFDAALDEAESPSAWKTPSDVADQVLDGTCTPDPAGPPGDPPALLPRGYRLLRRASESHRRSGDRDLPRRVPGRLPRDLRSLRSGPARSPSRTSPPTAARSTTATRRRAEAEAVFNWFMEDPRRCACLPRRPTPAGRLPVPRVHAHGPRPGPAGADPHRPHGRHPQRHRQDERRRPDRAPRTAPDVRFDLFHANWPYSGELLYLAKNYPERGDRLLLGEHHRSDLLPETCSSRRSSSVPHGKIHGYGSDYRRRADPAWAHADDRPRQHRHCALPTWSRWNTSTSTRAQSDRRTRGSTTPTSS